MRTPIHCWREYYCTWVHLLWDDDGWCYRRENGNYYKNTTKTIDGVKYTFDENGYVVSQG